MTKTLKGTVISDKMVKTVVVELEEMRQHRRYKKRIKRRKKYFAHNELKAKTGDIVIIESFRPLSKKKRWRVKEIVKSKE